MTSGPGISPNQDLHLLLISTKLDPLSFNELIDQAEKMLRSGGVGEGVGEGLPVLSEHSAVGVGDLNSIIGDLVVGGGDHEADNGLGLESPECGQDPNPEDRRLENRSFGSEARSAVRWLEALGEWEA